jgi:putative ABC transport system permease protein
MFLQPHYEGMFMAIKVKSEDMKQTVSTIENTWKATVPNYEFEYQFLDESFDKLFDQERRLGQLFGIFSGLGGVVWGAHFSEEAGVAGAGEIAG